MKRSQTEEISKERAGAAPEAPALSYPARGTALSRTAYGLLWAALVVCTVLAEWAISAFASMEIVWEFRRWYNEEDGFYAYYGYGHDYRMGIVSPDMESGLLHIGVIALALTVAAVVLLIVVLVLCGRFHRDGAGRVVLNWFDRIWSEVQIAAMIGLGLLFVLLAAPLLELWMQEDWFGLFRPNVTDTSFYGLPNRLLLAAIACGGVALALLTYLCAVSLVKKLKAHKFWEKSLTGGLVLLFVRGFRGSDRTTAKAVFLLLVLCALSASWIGLVVAVPVVLLLVPRLLKKYRAIRQGAARARQGDFSYQIPVQVRTDGTMGELDRLADDINRISHAQSLALENALKNERMRTELISNVSHDLKTPLTSMVTYIDLLKKEGLSGPNAPEYLDILERKTQRLKTLTEDLFEAAKAASGAMPVNMAWLDVAALLEQSLAEMEERLSARGLIPVVKNQCGENCQVYADGQLLWRVLENLLGNAAKYALEGSRLYLDLSYLPSYRKDTPSKVLLEVKNISAAPLNISTGELMERFTRGDASRNTEGSGLGLAITRDLVHLMGGTFEIVVDGDLFKACVVLEAAAKDAAAGSAAGAPIRKPADAGQPAADTAPMQTANEPAGAEADTGEAE